MYKHQLEWYPPSPLTPSRKVIKQIYQNVKLHISSQPLTDRCWCRNWQPWHPNETNIQFSKWIVLQRCQKKAYNVWRFTWNSKTRAAMPRSSVCCGSGRDQKLICCRGSDCFYTCGNDGMRGNACDKHVKLFRFGCFSYNFTLCSIWYSENCCLYASANLTITLSADD